MTPLLVLDNTVLCVLHGWVDYVSCNQAKNSKNDVMMSSST